MQGLYIVISITTFITIVLFLIISRRKKHRISTLTMFGITMIALSIIFRDYHWVGYLLIGIGVLLTVIDVKYTRILKGRK